MKSTERQLLPSLILAPPRPVVWKIGDTVRGGYVRNVDGGADKIHPPWDGTVVDIIEDTRPQQLVRVYWRYPLGRVSDQRSEELQRP